jgi:aryl-alcohol dehydrogenase-like predicted oxidoreductase
VETRSIGSLTVSVVGLGCNNFGKKLSPEESTEVVHAALDAGITFFDTSDRYGHGDHPFSAVGASEEFLGAALGSRRDQVVLATKFGNPMTDHTGNPDDRGGRRDYVHRACNASLKRLGTDYIDLFQIHRPDAKTPVEETLGALAELVEAGKVRVAGCSNFTPEMIDESATVGATPGHVRFESVQNEYSLLIHEDEEEALRACERNGIAFLPYFPLASGLLTGKYGTTGETPDGSRLSFWKPREHFDTSETTLSKLAAYTEYAADHDHTLLDLAMSWLASNPVIASVIAGATTPAQVRGNVAAASWSLSAAERAEVAALA